MSMESPVINRPRSRGLILRDEIFSACNDELVAYINESSAATGQAGFRPGEGPGDRRLLEAQFYLLLGAKRHAVAALEAIAADRIAYQAWCGHTFRCGDHLDTMFMADGEAYRYFYGLYNHTWRNERIVEIPVAERFLKDHPGRVLEIGNVLGHYYSHGHTVVDKYENADGIVSADIIDYAPDERFDTIVSISTLEHIGKDHSRDDAKPVRVYRHIVDNLLADRGRFLFTIPIGFNPVIDAHIDSGAIKPDASFCLKRVSAENDWVEVDWHEAKKSRYMEPFHCANALYFGVAGKNS